MCRLRLPRLRRQVAASLLQSTLAGGLGVDTIQIETPETAFEIKPVETRTVQITVVENDPEYEAELAEQAARAKALLDAENEPGEELPPAGMRKKTKFSLNYDFSDALDRSKVDAAVLALFPHFGLPTTQPSEAMSEEDIEAVAVCCASIKMSRMTRLERSGFRSDSRIYRNVAGIYKAVRLLIEADDPARAGSGERLACHRHPRGQC